MKVMFDLDGVLADFVSEFRAYAELPDDWYPQQYYFLPLEGSKYYDGDPKKAYFTITSIMKKVRNFWTTLAPLFDSNDGCQLENLSFSDNISLYFITSRFKTRGWSLKEQIINWFFNVADYISTPDHKIIVTYDKGYWCKKLGITYALEDSPAQAVKLNQAGIKCYLIDRQYNIVPECPQCKAEWKDEWDNYKLHKNWFERNHNNISHDLGKIPRVYSVSKFCKIILEASKNET